MANVDDDDDYICYKIFVNTMYVININYLLHNVK